MPRMRTVGKFQGDLDHVMYSLERQSTDMMRLKAAFMATGFINLATIVKPTSEDPLRWVSSSGRSKAGLW